MPSADSPRFVIKIFLYHVEPVIWRRFSMPGGATFADLHHAIQQSLGWSAEHLHEFRHGKGKRLEDVIAPDDPDVIKGSSFQEESTVTLTSFVGRRRLPLRLLYRYDFTDDWILEIVIEDRTEEGSGALPILLDGDRAGPPDDCGGPALFMDALNGDLEFLDDRFDPARFDPETIKFTQRRKR